MTSQQHNRIKGMRRTASGLLLFGSGAGLTSTAVLYGQQLIHRQYLDPIAGVPFVGVLGVVILLPLVLLAGLIGVCLLFTRFRPRIAGRTEYTIAGLAGLTGVVVALLQALVTTLSVIPVHSWPYPVESLAAVAVIAFPVGYVSYNLWRPDKLRATEPSNKPPSPDYVRERRVIGKEEAKRTAVPTPEAAAQIQRDEHRSGETPNNTTSEPKPAPGIDFDRLEYQWVTETDVSFDDVGGMADLKDELRTDIVMPLTTGRKKAEALDIPLPNILFHGPPGTGKTYMAKALATELGLPFAKLSGSDVQSKWINESPQKINTLFQEAKRVAESEGGAIVFLDELDAVLKSRTGAGGAHEEDNKVVAEFLNNLQEIQDHDVVFIGATNRMDAMDEAGIRAGRIDKKIYVGKPDKAARESILRAQLDGRDNNLTDEQIEYVANETEGMVAADIEAIVVDAARESAFGRGGDQIQWMDICDVLQKRSADSSSV